MIVRAEFGGKQSHEIGPGLVWFITWTLVRFLHGRELSSCSDYYQWKLFSANTQDVRVKIVNQIKIHDGPEQSLGFCGRAWKERYMGRRRITPSMTGEA